MLFVSMFVCLVTSVYDGDTARCIPEHSTKEIRVRFLGIDTPEMKSHYCPPQPYAKEAGRVLREMILDQEVVVESTGLDRYGRTLGTVIYYGIDVNEYMVEKGMAEVYRGNEDYQDHPYYIKELAARDIGEGMWALGDDYESPRRYRKRCFNR